MTPGVIAATLIAATLVVTHELLYRLTAPRANPLESVVSHGGADMLLMAAALIAAVIWVS